VASVDSTHAQYIVQALEHDLNVITEKPMVTDCRQAAAVLEAERRSRGSVRVIHNSLSCGFWGNCPVGAAPGIHLAGYDGTGAGSSITGGGVGTAGSAADGFTPSGIFDGGQDAPVVGEEPVIGQPDSGQSASPDASASPDSSASAPAEEEPDPSEPDPSSASPAAQPEGDPSSASPAAGQ
jgi:hypothetical protein